MRRAFELIRATACIGVGILILGNLMYVIAQSPRDNEVIANLKDEHRLTALETKMDTVIDEVQRIETFKTWELLGISGLIGEAGLRIIRRKA